MKAAVIADIHGSLKQLKKIKKQLNGVDIVIIVGDIAGTISIPLIIKSIIRFKKISREKYMELVFGENYDDFVSFQIETTEKIINFLKKLNKPCFLINGNADSPEIIEYLKKASHNNELLYFLDSSTIQYGSIIFAGYGYCQEAEYSKIQTPTVKSLEKIKEDLLLLKREILSLREEACNTISIGIFHEPPLNTKLDYIPFKKTHAGNPEISSFINDEFEFDFVFVGHIHESRNLQFNDSTLILNPGPLVNGYWSVVDLYTKKVFFKKNRTLTLSNFIYNLRRIFQ